MEGEVSNSAQDAGAPLADTLFILGTGIDLDDPPRYGDVLLRAEDVVEGDHVRGAAGHQTLLLS